MILARAALIALVLAASPALAQEGIEVHDAYAVASRPNAPSGSAFMVIHNHGGAPDRLVGASSPVAERVELHAHVIDANGVARMVEVEDGFDLPTDGTIALDRGGAHLMFLGITDAFEDGDVVPVTLEFERAGSVAIEVPVDLSRLGGGPAAGHDGGHGAGHGS